MAVDVYVPISTLSEHQTYDQIFLVKSCQQQHTRKGKPYAIITFVDVTGTISGPMWDGINITPGKFVRAEVQISEYNQQLQLVTHKDKVRPYEGTPDNMGDYILSANQDELAAYESVLRGMIDQLDDPHYRDIVHHTIDRISLMTILKTTPHELPPLQYAGGLLIYTTRLLRTALAIVDSTTDIEPPINRSLVIAGSLFHNIGSMITHQLVGSSWEPTDVAQLLSPEMCSFMMTNHLCISAESDLNIVIPEGKKLALQHVCLHNKAYTLESQIVHHAHSIVSLLERGAHQMCRVNVDSNWAGSFIGHLKDE